MAGVLITGASGLIGRRVVEAFGNAGTDRPTALRAGDADLLETGAWTRVLDEHRPEVVVHLAWSASSLPDYRNHGDNWRWAETTIAAAELAVERGIRFLATGTSVDDQPADDAYSQSKAAVRDALAVPTAANELGWLRPFYVFDEQRPSPAVLRAALAAKAVGAPVRLASPTARHDFVDARDVGTAIFTIVDAHLMGSLDIGSGGLTTVAELVEAFGCEWVSDGDASSAASSAAVADIAALRDAGWVPEATDARFARSR